MTTGREIQKVRTRGWRNLGREQLRRKKDRNRGWKGVREGRIVLEIPSRKVRKGTFTSFWGYYHGGQRHASIVGH